MRKKVLVLFAMLSLVTLGANAQIFVGGSFGFSSTTLDTGGSSKSGTSFKIMPEVGYQVDKKLAFGVQAGYARGYAALGSLTTSDMKGLVSGAVSMAMDVKDEDMKMSSFMFAPFVRLTLVEMGPASIFVEGAICYSSITTDMPSMGSLGSSLGSGSSSSSGLGSGPGASSSSSELKITAFDIAIRPGVACNIGKKMTAMVKIGTLGFISAKEKETDMKITRFGLTMDSYNLLLGLNYKF